MISGECKLQSIISFIHAFPIAAQTSKEYLGGVDWMLTSEVVIAGIVIVMLVLILLILIFKGFGKAVSRGNKSGENDAPQAPASVSQAVQVAPAPAPSVQNGISGEIVAAIAAAVYAAEGGKQVVIRSIRVKNVSGRNPWAAAAIADNTKPF